MLRTMLTITSQISCHKINTYKMILPLIFKIKTISFNEVQNVNQLRWIDSKLDKWEHSPFLHRFFFVDLVQIIYVS